ncbi:MAG: polysaccharide biosynthesis tyrosine autokinase, partial [Hydrocarboniphaga effusa]|nr:polysaccharide biosynthesis tyrosine autokinase [Hydrocarboniphaga effusa]
IGLDSVSDPATLTAAVHRQSSKFPAGQGYEAPRLRVCTPEQIPQLTERMLAAGYGDDAIRAVLGGNWLRLARDVQVNSELYTTLLNSAQELQVVKAGTVGNVRIIDLSLRPTKPAKPQKSLVLALSAVGGIFLGLVAIFVRRALHHGVEDTALVEERVGLATYATIPYSQAQKKLSRAKKGSRILAVQDSGNSAIEALRSLRTSLHFALMESKNNIIVLTGPTPNLGKSFLTVNLGAVLASSGKRVVVVDADLRKGHLHEYTASKRKPGLSDFIAGNNDQASVVQATGVQGLHLVSAGTLPPNPAELLLHPRCAALLQELSAKFDHVLIDTPPVLAVTDAAVIGRLAGCTLLVLKAGEHPIRQIEESARRLRQAGVELRGTLFNQV